MGIFNMKKIALILSLLPIAAFAESDAGAALNETISLVRSQCSGISAKMENIKKMAGIGTAVNAVGTVTGVGGVASGIVKYQKDKGIINLKEQKANVDLIIEFLEAEQEKDGNGYLLLADKVLDANFLALITSLQERDAMYVSKDSDGDPEYYSFTSEPTAADDKADNKKIIDAYKAESNKLQAEIDKTQKQSTAAGNARTALFAVDTATNVAGAVVSSKTVADEDLIEQIKKCKESVELLKTARMRAQIEDTSDLQAMNVSQNILNKCGEYQYLDLSKLNSLAKGAIVTNSVGAVSGTAATITSALGNNKKISDLDNDATQKNMKMNMASNVLGGVTTAASLTGTALNASQIVEAKKIVNVSQECEETLQW